MFAKKKRNCSNPDRPSRYKTERNTNNLARPILDTSGACMKTSTTLVFVLHCRARATSAPSQSAKPTPAKTHAHDCPLPLRPPNADNRRCSSLLAWIRPAELPVRARKNFFSPPESRSGNQFHSLLPSLSLILRFCTLWLHSCCLQGSLFCWGPNSAV
jgi:hypothetical protein